MTDRPIIFSGSMVRALLDGRKTMTRRLLKPQPYAWQATVIDITEPSQDEEGEWGQTRTDWGWSGSIYQPEHEVWVPLKGLHYRVGDRLWVREACSGPHDMTGVPPREWLRGEDIWYWADGNPEDGDWTKPKPGMHMPRWASRLTLAVTGVKVERLQEISEADAKAEGIYWSEDFEGWTSGRGPDETCDFHQSRPDVSFSKLWCALHGPDAWAANPWVVAVTFSIERKNIDGS